MRFGIISVEGQTEETFVRDVLNPPKHLMAALPGYDKVAHGPVIARRIGLQRIRAVCFHFNTWLTQLEHIAKPTAPATPVAPPPNLG